MKLIAVLLLAPACALAPSEAKKPRAAAQARRNFLTAGATRLQRPLMTFKPCATFVSSAASAYVALPRHRFERPLGESCERQTYVLPDLPYPYEALEPSIDAATMKFHHDKHHATYIAGVNTALEGKEQKPLADLMKGAITDVKGVRNAGGGVYNHDLFWTVMAPKSTGGAPSGDLATAIDEAFGSMGGFKEKWGAASAPAALFGSGWVWLIVGKDGKLAMTTTPNQDNPLMDGAACTPGIPILGLDVWEHAYYLKYQNRRPEYVAAWWDVVNWNKVNEYYADALKGKAPQF